MHRSVKYLHGVPRSLCRALHETAVTRALSFSVEDIVRLVEPTADALYHRESLQVVTDRDYKYKEGQNYHGFQCERVEYISDFDLTSHTLRHMETGLELWYLNRNDTNNVFSINFRTPPVDSTGVAHVLEHLTLNGSEKYPVRDPFFKMLNRSVATNMNALTGADLTVYIFSTRNETDYRNIQRIYLDSVFR